jgi:hypothetical protein
MLQKVIIGLVLTASLLFNAHIVVRDYLIQKEKDFYSEYLNYTVVSDRNGQIMGLLQLQTVAEPVVGDSIIIFTEDKEYYLTVNDMKEFNNLLVGNE